MGHSDEKMNMEKLQTQLIQTYHDIRNLTAWNPGYPMTIGEIQVLSLKIQEIESKVSLAKVVLGRICNSKV